MGNDDMIITSPLKAIRAFCLSCCGDSAKEVKECTSKDCVLKPFRFGTNPYTKREMTEEQRQQAAERLRKAREAKNNT